MNRLLRYLKQKYFERQLKNIRTNLKQKEPEFYIDQGAIEILLNYCWFIPFSDPDKDIESIKKWDINSAVDRWVLEEEIAYFRGRESELVKSLEVLQNNDN